MKSFTLALLLLPFSLLAQFAKGDQYLDGSFSLSKNSNHSKGSNGGYSNTVRYTVLNISPSYGYFINESVAIGLRANYFINQTKGESAGSSGHTINKYQSFLIGPTVRKYWTITDRFLFAASANLFYLRSVNKTLENKDVTYVSKSYHLGLAIAPTFIFFPSNRWGIEATLGALSYTFEKGLNEKWHEHSVDLDYGTLYLGLSYYFRK